MPKLSAGVFHISRRVVQTLTDDRMQHGPLADHFAVYNVLAGARFWSVAAQWPFDDQVGASADDGVLENDAPSALYHARSVGVQHELRPVRPLPIALHARLRWLPEVAPKGARQPRHVRISILTDIRLRAN